MHDTLTTLVLQTHEGRAAVEEAIRALEEAEPLSVLEVSAGLTKAAQEHAEDSGKVWHSRSHRVHSRSHRNHRRVSHVASHATTLCRLYVATDRLPWPHWHRRLIAG